MTTMTNLIDQYTDAHRMVTQEIVRLAAGDLIFPVGQDPAEATAAWLDKLKRSARLYESILTNLKRQATSALFY